MNKKPNNKDLQLPYLISGYPFMLVVAGTLDLYENEGDYFLMLLTPYLTSTVSTVCCLDTCPLKQHTVKSMSIVLPQPADTMDRRNIFSKSLDD